MAGRFNRKAKAVMVHSKVVAPKTGKMPKTVPKARQSAIFLRLIPSLSIDFAKLNIFVLISLIMIKNCFHQIR
jgi:hypothetical protein